MYEQLVPKLDKLEQGYETLSTKECIELTFEYVQQRTPIPSTLRDKCIELDVWNIIEPLIEEDVDEILTEFMD